MPKNGSIGTVNLSYFWTNDPCDTLTDIHSSRYGTHALIAFLILTGLGSLIWSAILAYAGFVLGANYHKVANYVSTISHYIIIGAGLIILFVSYKRIKNFGVLMLSKSYSLPKIIFLDIDDTLYIKDEQRIPQSVKPA